MHGNLRRLAGIDGELLGEGFKPALGHSQQVSFFVSDNRDRLLVSARFERDLFLTVHRDLGPGNLRLIDL